MKSSSKPSISLAMAAELGLEPRRLMTALPGREYRALLPMDREEEDRRAADAEASASRRLGMGMSSSSES